MPHIPLVVWLVFSGPSSPVADSIPMRATVWIRAGDRAVGTGWVVDAKRGLIVTARHVVADRKNVEVFFQDHRDGKPITDRAHYLSNRAELQKSGRVTTAEVVAKNDGADLAILRASKIPLNVPELKLASSIPRIGHECYSIGHRHDAETLWCRTTGSIRQIGKLSEGHFWAGKRIGVGVDVIQIQSPIESGESGAALLDSRNEVIGVVSAVSNRTPGLAIATALGDLHKLLAQARQDQRVIEEKQTVEERPDVAALLHSTVWVRPQATEGRFAGVLIDRKRGLVLTTVTAVGKEDVVDVIAPKWEKGRLLAESYEYRDLLGLRLAGHCVQAVVLARDDKQDLALVQLDNVGIVPRLSLPNTLEEVSLAFDLQIGQRVSAMSHPVGEELLWLHSHGTVRSMGKVSLRRDGGGEGNVSASLLQLPHQGSSCGGPVVNSEGHLIGILASREGTRQEVAYAVIPAEIRKFVEERRSLWNPESRTAFYERSKILIKVGRKECATHGLRVDASLGTQDTLIAAHFAKLLAETGESQHAERMLIAIHSKLERSPEVNALMAEAYLTLGKRKSADVYIDAALKQNSKLASALVSRAAIRSGKDALADIESALEIDPSVARAYALRASLRDPKDPDFNEKTIADFTRAIELEPYDVAIRSRRAAIYLAANDYKKAAGDFARITELEPLKANWWLDLANAIFLAGDRVAARRSYVAAIRIDPKREAKVFAGIRRNGKTLLDDNPTDVERVADWYVSAIRDVLPFVGDKHKERLTEFLKQAADQSDMRKRMELLALVIEDFAGSK